MRKFMMALCMLFLAGAALAQTADELEGARYDAHGALMYETTDPAGNRVTVVVDPKPELTRDDPTVDPESPDFKGFANEESEKELGEVSRAVTVKVYAVADEEYRAAHSNWTSYVGNIIENADNAYIRDFGINWSIDSYWNWNSSGGNASAILSNLASVASGLGRGLVQGFSADSNFDAGGIAYVYNSNPYTGYSVCLDQGSSSTTYALRHEIGHNYGCSHDFGSTVCMMNYTYSYSVDYFDSAHDSLISGRTGWFR